MLPLPFMPSPHDRTATAAFQTIPGPPLKSALSSRTFRVVTLRPPLSLRYALVHPITPPPSPTHAPTRAHLLVLLPEIRARQQRVLGGREDAGARVVRPRTLQGASGFMFIALIFY